MDGVTHLAVMSLLLIHIPSLDTFCHKMDVVIEKLDRVIELLETLVQRWSPMELPKTNKLPIVRDLHQIPNPLQQKPSITPIVFENTEPPSKPKSTYKCPEGWVECKVNDDFEMNEKTMMIRHKLTKQECKVKYDTQLYPVPYFDNYVFDEQRPPRRYIRVVAEQFEEDVEGYNFVYPKNGNRFDYSRENVLLSNNRPHPGIPLNDKMVLAKDGKFVGPHTMLGEEKFENHNVIEWNYEIWQETYNQVYVKAPKVQEGWLVLNDDDKPIVVSLTE